MGYFVFCCSGKCIINFYF